MMLWGDERRSRRARRLVTRWDSPAAVIAAVIWLVIVLCLGPRALDMEQAQERATIGGAR